jgi:beta-galactosidase
MIAQLDGYVAAGGHLLITTRSGLKNEQGHLWEARIQQPIWDLIGGEIQFYDHLPSARPGKVDFEGAGHSWHLWGTVIEPRQGTETWARFADQFYAGKSAVLHREASAGSVTYVGVWSDEWALESKLLRKLYRHVVGDLPFDLRPYVFADYRDGVWVAVNYTDRVASIPVPEEAEILVGTPELDPAGVVVWRKP